MKKYVNGKLVDLTEQEKSELIEKRNQWESNSFNRKMEELRIKRNALLSETDFYALSDVTMTLQMTQYRQALRDITNNLTTVEDIEDVVFPERPEA